MKELQPEVKKDWKESFDEWDQDRDGFVTKEEYSKGKWYEKMFFFVILFIN